MPAVIERSGISADLYADEARECIQNISAAAVFNKLIRWRKS